MMKFKAGNDMLPNDGCRPLSIWAPLPVHRPRPQYSQAHILADWGHVFGEPGGGCACTDTSSADTALSASTKRGFRAIAELCRSAGAARQKIRADTCCTMSDSIRPFAAALPLVHYFQLCIGCWGILSVEHPTSIVVRATDRSMHRPQDRMIILFKLLLSFLPLIL